MSVASILTAENLTLRLDGRLLLGPLDLTAPRGAVSLLLGANGSGKTLLLRTLNGLLTPSAGRIDAPPPQRRAMVFQRPLMLRRSVAANLAYPLRLRGVPKRERQRRVEAMLQRTQLTHLADRYAPTLSGGESQTLALARAWIQKPELMLLDEPSANLDPAARRKTERLIADIAASGVTTLMTTHDLTLARRLGQGFFFLHRGRLRACGDAESVFDNPQDEALRAFLEGDPLP